MLATHSEHVHWKRVLARRPSVSKEHVDRDQLLVYGDWIGGINLTVMTFDQGGHEGLECLKHVDRVGSEKARVFKLGRG